MARCQFLLVRTRLKLYKKVASNYKFISERLQATKSVRLGLPRFTDVPLAMASSIPQGQGPAVIPPYAITPEDHLKYHSLFLSYDTDKDGYACCKIVTIVVGVVSHFSLLPFFVLLSFLQGSEAVAVFSKSGLTQDVLRAIWALADDDKDSVLSPKEFAVAFHLIVCVSKRGLPVPEVLPPPLATFLQRAPVDPTKTATAPAAVSQPVPVAKATTAPMVTAPVTVAPVAVPVSVNKVSVSDAFGEIETRPLPPASLSSAAVPSSSLASSDVAELSQSLTAVTDVSKKAISLQQASMDLGERTTDSLKMMVKRLREDKVTMNSAVAQAESELEQVKLKQQAALAELDSLRQEMAVLQGKLAACSGETGTVKDGLVALREERASLVASRDRLRGELQALSGDIETTAMSLGSSDRLSAELVVQRGRESLETVLLRSEIAVLRDFAASLQAEKQNSSARLDVLQKQLQTSTKKSSPQQQELAEARRENESLRKEKDELLQKITAMSSTDSNPNPSKLSASAGMVSPLINRQTREYLSSISTPIPVSTFLSVELPMSTLPRMSPLDSPLDSPLVSSRRRLKSRACEPYIDDPDEKENQSVQPVPEAKEV